MKRVKVAEVVDLKSINSSKITLAIKKIISDKSYTQKAEYYDNLLRKAGGIEKATELIEDVMQA